MRSLETYRDLIVRVEELARRNPFRYRATLAALAALGFAYVIGIVLLALGGVAVLLGLVVLSHQLVLLKLALIPLALSALLMKSLRVRIPPPDGRRLTREEAPSLFAEIECVRKAVKARPVHEVILTPDFNAAVTQIPRLGFLGWQKRYLILGLPLLAALPPYQFRAVLAHEFGHLAANHARFSNWVYRVRKTWERMLQSLELTNGSALRVFTWFFEKYAPYFNAYSFVLARANEYEADRESARVTSREDAGDALVAVYAKGEYLESDFWKTFYRRADNQPQPPTQPFVEFVSGLRSIPQQASETALTAALARQTGLEDTHPCLADRLEALGVQPRPPACFQITAAHALLGNMRAQLLAEFDRAWRDSIARPWTERHAFMQSMKEKLTLYAAAARTRELTEDEQWDFASAIEGVKGGKAAKPILDVLLRRAPDHAPALYARGRNLLEENDERGAADIERAMALDEEAREPGAQLLYSYFYSRNDFSRCDRYRNTLEETRREREQAAEERLQLEQKDVLESHGLSAQQLQPWLEALAVEGSVKRAWLVRRHVKHLLKSPAYVLIVQFSLLSLPTFGRGRAIARLSEAVPAWCCLIRSTWDQRSTARRVKKIAGTPTYSTI